MADKPTYEELEQKIAELKSRLDACPADPVDGDFSEVDFKRLAAGSLDAIYHYDLETRKFLFANRIFLDYFGNPGTRIEDMNTEMVAARIHEDDREMVDRTVTDAIRSGLPYGDMEYRLLHPDGSLRWVHDRWTILRDKNGSPRATEGFIRDTTIRKMADAELEASNNRILIGAYIIQDGKLKYVNPEFIRITGYTAEELNGRNPLDIVHEDYRDIVRDNAVRMLKGELSEPYELCAVTKGGELRWAMETVSSVRHGGRRAVLGYFMDITRMRNIQHNLASLGLMVGAISHSLKNCLTGLDAALYMIDTGFYRDKPARIEEGLDTAMLMVDRLSKLVYDVLYYVKERELETEPVDVMTFINEVITIIATRMRGAAIDFQCRLSPPLGSFEVDRDLIRPALLNILENAMEACIADDSGKSHRIELAVMSEPESVLIKISDNGPGMNDEQKKNAFGLFVSSKGKKGTGLGLFITKQVINQHGGSVAMESAEGDGSNFTIRLPKKYKKTTDLGVTFAPGGIVQA